MFDTIGAIGGTAACADIGERYVPEFHPPNFCDLVIHAPCPE